MNITKNKLIEALTFLGERPDNSMKKDELMEMLNKAYSEDIDNLVAVINNETYSLLKMLVQADENGVDVSLDLEEDSNFLEELLIIEETVIDEKSIHIKFRDGMKDNFVKFINKENERKIDTVDTIKNLIIDIVDRYGVIEDYELVNMLSKLLCCTISMKFVYMLLMTQIDLLSEIKVLEYEDEEYFVSIFADFPEDIIEERKTRELQYKECTIESLEENRIDNLVERKEAKDIKKFLKYRKVEYSEEIVSELICNIMNMVDCNIDNFKKLINIDLDDIDVANDYLQLIIKLYNSIPQFALYGYSPNELVKIQMEKRQKEQEIIKKNKIGRNAPCPCGSGRKYKHCCLNKVIKVDFINIQYDDCEEKKKV